MEDNRCTPGVVVIFNNLRLILRPTIEDRSAGISLLDHIDLVIMHTIWQQIDDSDILVLLDLRFKKVALQAESIAICFPDGIAANSFPRRSRPPIIISVEARNFFYGQFFRAGQHIIAAFLRQIDKNRLISVLVAVNTPCLIGIADLLRPVRNMGLIRVAVDRVDLELDAFAVLHRIIVPEDDLVAIAGLILIEINRKVAAGIHILLRDGIGLRCTVCVIGYDLINDICKRLSVSQLGICPVGFQPNKLQCLIQSLQHGLTVFRDNLTILDHNVPQRCRLLLIVVQDDSPWIGIGLIGIYIIDIPLCRPFGKPPLRAGIFRQTEAERIVRFGVRFTFGRIARNGGQLHAVVKVRDQLIRKCIKLTLHYQLSHKKRCIRQAFPSVDIKKSPLRSAVGKCPSQFSFAKQPRKRQPPVFRLFHFKRTIFSYSMTNCGKYGILDAAPESGPRTAKKDPQQTLQLM